MLTPKQNIFGLVILAVQIAVGPSVEGKRHHSRRSRPPHIHRDYYYDCIRAPTTYNFKKIYKGEASNINQYPFMVSVHIMKEFNCGGILYSKDMVLTSASCVQLLNNGGYREQAHGLAVRVGSNHSSSGGVVIKATEVFFHPSYNPITLVFNIAAIRLSEPAIGYDMIARCIQVVDTPNAVPSNVDIFILGWGEPMSKPSEENENDFLQMKIMPVYSHYFCEEIYGEEYITLTSFCAGTITTGEGACKLDAGGPAILDGKLVGIISSGAADCGSRDSPTIFTHIGHVATWLYRISLTTPKVYKKKADKKKFYEELNADYDAMTETTTADDAMTGTNITDEAMSGKIITGEAMSGPIITDKIMSGKIITDEAMSGKINTDEVISGKIITDNMAVKSLKYTEHAVEDGSVNVGDLLKEQPPVIRYR